MSELPYGAYDDEAAAEAGDFIAAVTLKLASIADRAFVTLEPTGAFEPVAQQFAAAAGLGGAGADELWEAAVEDEESRYVFGAAAAADFLLSAEPQRAAGPLPASHAAANILLDVWMFRARLRRLRRALRRDTVDLQGIAELMWIGMRVGGLAEGFNPTRQRSEQELRRVEAELQKRLDGAKRGVEQSKENRGAAKLRWWRAFATWFQPILDDAVAKRGPLSWEKTLKEAEEHWPERGFFTMSNCPTRETLKEALEWAMQQDPPLFRRDRAPPGGRKRRG